MTRGRIIALVVLLVVVAVVVFLVWGATMGGGRVVTVRGTSVGVPRVNVVEWTGEPIEIRA